ncbi:MAG: TIGR03118 family protein, partial [Isosphaeraceae bacterium]
MIRFSPFAVHRFGFSSPRTIKGRGRTASLCRSGPSLEILEDRTLLSLALNNVRDLTALAISAVQNASTTQDVATFQDTDATAVASDFTATINWGDGSSATPGTVTEDAAQVFHVSGTHTYAQNGSFPVTVTIRDSNGTLYATNAFNQTNLVSSVAGMAGVIDPNLINPWGTSSGTTPTNPAGTPIWVSDQGKGLLTLYNPNGSPITQALVVTVPPSGTPSGPTGQVFNADTTTTDFNIPAASGTVPSLFLFATLAGTIDGWNPGSTGGAGSAVVAATVSGASFTGLAQASDSTGFHLFAADITGTTGANGIDVFDPSFTNVSSTTFAGKFADPNAVAGYRPYNIALLNGNLYVAYVQPSGIVTTGGGYIDEFDTSGNFINRIYTDTAGTNVKGPWGMAIAPAGFGTFAGDLLVGNFGDATATLPNGTISVISLPTTPGTPGTLVGTLSTPNGTIANAGLWSFIQGNGGKGGAVGTLYFTAGISAQTQGLLGSISFSPNGTATVAGLTASATQPTVSTTEGHSFSGPVASFTNGNSASTSGQYNYVTIDWGDGTPASAGTVSQPGGPGTAFLVSGTHTYADAGVNGGTGHYSITVNIHDQNGLTLAITNTADVADVPLAVTGQLNPASDSGASNFDNITNVVQPNFIGTTSEPNATVTLYAQAMGSSTPVVIGQGVSNANDAWSITSNQALADGSYTIMAVAVDSAGNTTSSMTTLVSPLVIDTVGPRVTSVSFNRLSGQILVGIQDYGGQNNAGVGLNVGSLMDANNYSLMKYDQHGPNAYLVTSIIVTPGTLTGTQLVTLQFNGGKELRGGHYYFTVRSVSPSNLTGIRDIAGNALDGEFYGNFPSG